MSFTIRACIVDFSMVIDYVRDVNRYREKDKIMLPQEDYKTHNHVKFLVNYHFVWIPKRRKKVLIGDIPTRTRQIFMDLAIEKGWDILALEVAPDHVHLFVSVKPTDTPHLVIKAFKGRSSFYLRKEFPQLMKLPSLWTNSYFISTAGNISSEAVRKYINDPHHGSEKPRRLKPLVSLPSHG